MSIFAIVPPICRSLIGAIVLYYARRLRAKSYLVER